ncbi:competence protein ComK [Amphibacillus jilinensis]|uniref:competence protein ComK n=1 Tax=Amphibacillus jilinensis TaxID=1216008 RepID=UPI00030EF0C0|nr:competence protein ComK [Amphibacillus jilinensis]
MLAKAKTSHELSHTTMAFIATEIDDSWGTLIYEEEREEPIIVNTPPGKLMEAAYRYYGEELVARFDGAKILCDFNNKPPIAISVTHHFYFFPTHSSTNPYCSWFSHTHIRKITKAKYGGSEVCFRDGRKLMVPVSEGIMLNQLHRTAQYRFMLGEQLKPVHQKEALNALIKALGYPTI